MAPEKQIVQTLSLVPEEVREQYILSGYRPVASGFSYCIKSAVYVHNETLNFWTHFLPLLYFIYWTGMEEFWLSRSLPHHFMYPFYGYILSVCVLFSASSFAHLLNSVSWHCRDLCFLLDYGAITLYGTASAIAFYFYSRPRHGKGTVLECSDSFMVYTTVAAVFAMLACCWTRLYPSSNCYLIRTTAFAMPFAIGSIPAVSRLITTFQHDPNLNPHSPHHAQALKEYYENLFYRKSFILFVVMMAGAAIVNVMKYPEKWSPGRFDIIGHSHQWFHILVFFSIREQFWLMLHDLKHRAKDTSQHATLLNTLGVLLVLVMSLGITIMWFCNKIITSARFKDAVKSFPTGICQCAVQRKDSESEKN